MVSRLPLAELKPIVDNAIREDLGWGDITTDNLIPLDLTTDATLLAKADGILAGIEVFAFAFQVIDPRIAVEALAEDGSHIHPGDRVAALHGPAASILRGERVALNFVQRLSGIATETRRCVEAVVGTKARIVDTRKTTPGLRILEKYAIRVGGGFNHRFNLSDGVLVKDNHLAAMAARGYSPREVIAMLRERVPHTVRIEVEIDRLDQLGEVLMAGADVILLDNFGFAEMRQAVETIDGRALAEASGGITMETVRAVAETGVDIISIGALTHTVRSLDISLDM